MLKRCLTNLIIFSVIALPVAMAGTSLDEFSNNMRQAKKDHVNVFSPYAYKKADSLHVTAKKYGKRGKTEKLNDVLTEATTWLNKATNNTKVAKNALAKATRARLDARDAGATQFDTEYDAIEKRFIAATRNIERGHIDSARNAEQGLVKGYRALEVKAIRESTLGSANSIIREAVKLGATKLAPTTYAATQKQLKSTEAFISSNPKNKEELRTKAADTLFKANRLLALTKTINKLEKQKSEQTALWVEGLVTSVQSTLSEKDLRDLPIREQIASIRATTTELVSDRDFLVQSEKTLIQRTRELENMVAKLEGTTEEERLAKTKLEEEKRFRQLYEKVRKQFQKDEAEVYKEGEKLVVRLKKMTFPVGQSVIPTGNYALLSKVQRAIRSFEQPNVIIEGHTDSTGSSATNEHLSQMRANAVKNYLVANNTLGEKQVEAVGYGSERPLASNASKSGRATNRRIDVIIQPANP